MHTNGRAPHPISILSALLVLAWPSWFLACSSSSDQSAAANTPATGAEGGTDASSHDGSASDSGTDAGSPNTFFPDADSADVTSADDDAGSTSCANADASACTACCSSAYPMGQKAFTDALIACACATDHCKTACATSICAATPMPPDGGDSCESCVHSLLLPDAGDAGCVGQIESACMADKDCQALQGCNATCVSK